VVYYVSPAPIPHADILEYLGGKLPHYMLPSVLVHLTAFPLAVTGKVDRRALPEPTFQAESQIVGPRTPLEEDLHEIWSEVLDIPQSEFGITDSFFHLGGDSIVSIQLAEICRQVLNLSITPKDIFDHKTIKALSERLSQPTLAQSIGNIQTPVPFKSETESFEIPSEFASAEYLERLERKRAVEHIFVANSLQMGFIYNSLRIGSEEADGYSFQIGWKYDGELFPEFVKKAWGLAMETFPALRLRFAWEEDKILQVIDVCPELDFTFADLTEMSDLEQEERIRLILKSDNLRLFKLDEGRLFRVHLIRTMQASFTFLFSYHHVIMDGWSLPILLSAVTRFYNSLANGETPLVEIDLGYLRTQKYLQESAGEHLFYWKNQMSRIGEVNELVGLTSANLAQAKRKVGGLTLYDSVELPITLQGSLADKLRKVSRNAEVTLSSVLLYTWHKVLKVFGTVDVTVVGTVLSGRGLPLAGIEKSVGLYINTLPAIVEHSKDKDGTLMDAIRLLQLQVSEMNARSTVHLTEIANATNQMPYNSKRLFDSIFAFENFPTRELSQASGKFNFISLGEKSIEKQEYPLVIFAWERQEFIELRFLYDSSSYDKAAMTNMASTFLRILEQMAQNGLQEVKGLELVNPAIYRKITEEWGRTPPLARPPTFPKTLHGLVEMRVGSGPERLALVYEDQALTYAELDRRAGQLALNLKAGDVGRGDLVVLMLDRSEHILIGMLGVLKSGAAFVPVDPTFPAYRISYIIKDTGTKVVVTNKRQEGNTVIQGVTAIFVESPEVAPEFSEWSMVETNENDLAYCIYTSGTTGEPKGVLLQHGGIVNSVLANAQLLFATQPKDIPLVSLSCCSYAFDAFLFESFAPLSAGGVAHLVSETVRLDPTALGNYMQDNQIQFAYLPTAIVPSMPKLSYPSLQAINCGGEAYNVEAARYWLPRVRLFNAYGPTEISVAATSKWVDVDRVSEIGSPFPGVSCYVMDPHSVIVPPLAVGELFIGGPGLARGYLNDEAKTKASFIRVNFSNGHQERLFATRDLARWTLDGNLEYLGRADLQVKIRGFRVELAEIETALSGHSSISECVVVARDESLVGYCVADLKFSTKEVLDMLRAQLPDFMIPACLIKLERMPLKPNGKVDREALPEPEFEVSDLDFSRPTNELELGLSEIWAEVLNLKVESIGLHTSFFELGGNSIKTIQLVSRIKERTGMVLSVKDVFEQKTISRICSLVIKSQGSLKISPSAVNSFQSIQAPLEVRAGRALDFTYSRPSSVNLDRVEAALRHLHETFDALSLTLTETDDGFLLAFDPKAEMASLIITPNLTKTKLKESNGESGSKRPLSLTCSLDHSESTFLFSLRSVLANDSSYNLLLTEFLHFLDHGEGTEVPREEYRTWLLTRQAIGQHNDKYWERLLESYTPIPVEIGPGGVDTVTLSQAISLQLRQGVPFLEGVELRDILLSALSRLLTHRWGLEQNVVLVVEDKRPIEFENTAGSFEVAYPFLLSNCKDSIEDNLLFTKESLRYVPEGGVGFSFASGSERRPNLSIHFKKRANRLEDSHLNLAESAQIQIVVSEMENRSKLSVIGGGKDFLLEFVGSIEHVLASCAASKAKTNFTMSEFPDFQPFVLCKGKSGAESSTAFFFPPGSGGAENYLGNLVPELGGGRDLLLFNNYYSHLRKFNPEKSVGLSLEFIGKLHLVQMKMIQPKGPYDLFGWSSGGMLAFETVRQLLLAGDQVASLVIVDS